MKTFLIYLAIVVSICYFKGLKDKAALEALKEDQTLPFPAYQGIPLKTWLKHNFIGE